MSGSTSREDIDLVVCNGGGENDIVILEFGHGVGVLVEETGDEFGDGIGWIINDLLGGHHFYFCFCFCFCGFG